jgi:multisubunit Na+/H+ antiporter MnhE subunit
MTTTSPQRRPLLRRVLGFVLFAVLFLRALVVASLQITRTILFEKRGTLAPGFLTYPVEELSPFEILVLSHCITLTPGTTTVEISADFTQLTLHALDARDPEATVSSIRSDLEVPILWWTR